MPGRRIKDLTALSGAGSANNDDVVIFDTNADTTKRISRSQLAEGMTPDLPLQYYLGVLNSNPTQRLNGDALTLGDYYLDAVTKYTTIYNGSGWNSYASVIAAQAAAEAARNAAQLAETNAETAETNAELAETNAELAEVNAEAARDAALAAQTAAELAEANAESARDAAFVNADVYADIATGLAAVANGVQFQVVTGDEIIRYRRDSSSTYTQVARYRNAEGYDALIDALPASIRFTVREQSSAPLLVNYQDGVEFDFTQARDSIVRTKVNGQVNVSAVDDFLSVTNTGLPTITLSGGGSAVPRHNLFANSATPIVGDSLTITIGVSYTIYVFGTGSLTITRILASGGTSIGTATEAAPLTFTALDIRVRINGIVGTVDAVQLQRADAEAGYIESGAAARYGVAISRYTDGEMSLLVDAAAMQTILLDLSLVPALGSEWLFYFDCYSNTVGAADKYFLAFDNSTGLANYFRLRSDGIVGMQVASVSQFTATLPAIPQVDARFEFVARVKNQAVILSSQGNPPGGTGCRTSSVFAPTRLNVGNWAGAGSGPPGRLHIKRFAIIPVGV